MQKYSYRKVLSDELEARMARNASYSLRAFARDLGLSHSSLSRVLAGEQGLSQTKAVQIADELKLSGHELQEFKSLVLSECARSKKVRDLALQKLKEDEHRPTELSLEYFRIISNWQHYAIIELSEVSDFKNDPKWIAERLGISPKEVKEALVRLYKLELIEETEDGSFKKSQDFRMASSPVPNRSIKNHHQQILKKAEAALFEQPQEERSFGSTTFAMSSDTMAWAKEEMKKFRHTLTHRLSAEKNKDRLYAFSMQLFALDDPKSLPKKKVSK